MRVSPHERQLTPHVQRSNLTVKRPHLQTGARQMKLSTPSEEERPMQGEHQRAVEPVTHIAAGEMYPNGKRH